MNKNASKHNKFQLQYYIDSAAHGPSLTRIANRSIVMLPFPCQILVHIGLESTKKRSVENFPSQRNILTLVASAFTPFTNSTSESASVYNGMC